MKISVTGASGFIGQKLVHALNEQGHTVTVLSRNKNRNFPPDIKTIIGDLTNSDSALELLFKNCDVFFHCAGELQNQRAMRQLHVGGVERMLKIVHKQRKQRKIPLHWVQLSSVGVYGPPKDKAHQHRVITEESVLAPKGEYETTKAEADKLIIHAAEDKDMTYSIVRPSNVFGPNMPNNSLRSLIKSVQKGLFFYIGEQGAIAPYVYADDVVEVLLQCADKQEAKGEVFNVSFDSSLENMISTIAEKLGVRAPWLRLPETLVRIAAKLIVKSPLTQEGINALVARTEYPNLKLEKKLGFKPTISVASRLNEITERK